MSISFARAQGGLCSPLWQARAMATLAAVRTAKLEYDDTSGSFANAVKGGQCWSLTPNLTSRNIVLPLAITFLDDYPMLPNGKPRTDTSHARSETMVYELALNGKYFGLFAWIEKNIPGRNSVAAPFAVRRVTKLLCDPYPKPPKAPVSLAAVAVPDSGPVQPLITELYLNQTVPPQPIRQPSRVLIIQPSQESFPEHEMRQRAKLKRASSLVLETFSMENV